MCIWMADCSIIAMNFVESMVFVEWFLNQFFVLSHCGTWLQKILCLPRGTKWVLQYISYKTCTEKLHFVSPGTQITFMWKFEKWFSQIFQIWYGFFFIEEAIEKLKYWETRLFYRLKAQPLYSETLALMHQTRSEFKFNRIKRR